MRISFINSSSSKYRQVWDLREEILRKPLGMSLKNDDLSWDTGDTIFIAEENDQVIGCLMLHDIGGNIMKLRQMAVYNDWQRKGVGRKLVEASEEFAGKKGYRKMALHARKEATGFYTSLGYIICSDEFTEVGIPHFAMEKALVNR